jgi:Coenzyme PQQ synthesis protein D (PqqD)
VTPAQSKHAAQSPLVCRFPIDGGLLLLDRDSNCLFAYNDTARHVWDLIQEGRTKESLVSEFAHAWAIPHARARVDINAIVAEWRAQNILVDPGLARRHPESLKPRSVDSVWGKLEVSWWTETVCTIRGTPIAFAVEPEILGPFRSLFAHLETPHAVPQVRLEIRTASTGEMVLIEDGRERFRTADPAEVIGGLYVAVLERTRCGLDWFALIHGAALGTAGKSVALAGPSGSGKSTLAAGLMGRGYDFLADDLIALSEPHGMVVPWPLPLSIKQGSFEIVKAHHPQLAKAAPYRTKGLEARALIPSSSAWEADPIPLRCLVFPHFAEGAEPHARRLSSFETVERLLSDRIWLGSPMTEQRVSAFLVWVDRTPSYALSYGCLADGMQLIGDVFA